MTNAERRDRLNFIGDLAVDQLNSFEPLERARLYEGLALVYTGEKAEAAQIAAYTIRKAEAAQLKFRELLRPEGGR